MWCRPVVVVLLASSFVQAYTVDEPMVAFVCNRPAMHSTDRGWVSDDSANCISDPVDILNYCRKVYPHLDVWNVVEASEKVTIANWCNFAHNNCHHRFKVRPFRCLVGAFQSEALRVPEHCQFDHIHDSSECKTYDAWNVTTSAACHARHGATLHRFSVLQPCAIDGFNGAEFVCCPPPGHLSTTTLTPVTTARLAPPTTWMTSSPRHQRPRYHDDDDDDVTSGRDRKHRMSEHARFVRAKTELEKRHHEKVNKMMKEWSAARRRVQEIKKIDMKGGEKFNREMTARFQKAYESLEHEAAMERKKLLAEHQRHVEDELAKKKTNAMNDYLDALAADEPDASRVMTSLLQYVKAEQKDRVHTISHYEHVEQSDPVDAESQRSTVAAHLRGIDERVTQAIDMLARLPRFQKKIRAQIERFLSSYQTLDESLAVIMAKISEKSNKTPGKSFMTAMTSESRDDQTTVAIPKQEQTTAAVTSDAVTATEPDRSPVVTPSSTKRSPETSPSTATTEEAAAARRFVPVKQVVQHSPIVVAHNRKSDFSVLESYIQKMPVRSQSHGHLAALLAFAVCGVAVFVLVVAGIAMARRGRSTSSDSLSVTEIDRSTPRLGYPAATGASPLPVNGYENPTYQYYQAAEAAAAEAGKDAEQ